MVSDSLIILLKELHGFSTMSAGYRCWMSSLSFFRILIV